MKSKKNIGDMRRTAYGSSESLKSMRRKSNVIQEGQRADPSGKEQKRKARP